MALRFLRLFVDRRVPLVAKIGFLLFTCGYALFPVDFLPDILPIVGVVDDASVFLASAVGFTSYAKRQIAKQEGQDSMQE